MSFDGDNILVIEVLLRNCWWSKTNMPVIYFSWFKTD